MPIARNGQGKAYDFAITNALQKNFVDHAAAVSGGGAVQYAGLKRNKYATALLNQDVPIAFQPLVMDAFGAWDPDALISLTQLARGGEYITQSAVFRIPITDDGEVLIGGDERERTGIYTAKSGCSELMSAGGGARRRAGGRWAQGGQRRGKRSHRKQEWDEVKSRGRRRRRDDDDEETTAKKNIRRRRRRRDHGEEKRKRRRRRYNDEEER